MLLRWILKVFRNQFFKHTCFSVLLISSLLISSLITGFNLFRAFVFADVANVPVYIAEKHFKQGRFGQALTGFKEAIQLSPSNERAWAGYDKCLIKIHELENSPNKVIKEPKFEVAFDNVQFHDVEKFKRRYVSITGKVRNGADISFKNIKVILTLFKENGTQADTRKVNIKAIDPREEIPFKFQSIVNHFADYKVHVEL
jgi:tetratricopeptide (TPR) repeat protein